MADILAISMFAFTCIALMGGYNVAFTLSGVSLIFASAGVITGTFEVGKIFFWFPVPNVTTNWTTVSQTSTTWTLTSDVETTWESIAA